MCAFDTSNIFDFFLLLYENNIKNINVVNGFGVWEEMSNNSRLAHTHTDEYEIF